MYIKKYSTNSTIIVSSCKTLNDTGAFLQKLPMHNITTKFIINKKYLWLIFLFTLLILQQLFFATSRRDKIFHIYYYHVLLKFHLHTVMLWCFHIFMLWSGCRVWLKKQNSDSAIYSFIAIPLLCGMAMPIIMVVLQIEASAFKIYGFFEKNIEQFIDYLLYIIER